MSENITVARPYAKAIFNIAKRKNKLDEWDKILSYLSIIINDHNIVNFIKNRTISYDNKSRVIINLLGFYISLNENTKDYINNFLNILSYHNRFLCVENICNLYKQYMNLELGYMHVIVKVAYDIDNSQKKHIIDCLSNKFNKKILALFKVDKKLLGGFLVKIDDFVLDASIAGNLASLRTKIAL